jgi:amidase
MASQISSVYGTLKDQYTASQIAKVNVLKRQYQKEYMEYWNSTSSLTGTGRPVDAVIAPLAPFAAARPDMYDYYGTSVIFRDRLIFWGGNRNKFGTGENKTKRIMPGMSVWVNLLDYSAAVLPVTNVDKGVDVVDVGYKPMNGVDEKVWQACKF